MEDSKKLNVVVISRETIKPSSPSPSPDNPTTFKLSLLDQLSGQFYVPLLLFYRGLTQTAKPDLRSQHLKSSLSKTLSHFYPFAGRMKDHLTLNCNDEGVEFVEARVVNSCLASILQKPNPKHLTKFLPEESADLSIYPMFLIQVSFFECGGMAIGMKISHNVADAATFTSFINSWANSTLGKDLNSPKPDFTASRLFPPADSKSLPFLPKVRSIQDNPSVKSSRFVFNPSELAALQAKAASEKNPHPTRFEAVSALLWKTALLAKKGSKLGSERPSALMWAVNLRSRLQPPLPAHCFGNLFGLPLHLQKEVSGGDLPVFASYLKQGTETMCDDMIKKFKRGEVQSGILQERMNIVALWTKASVGAIDLYALSSWCNFSLYKADFGWGKPQWVTTGGLLQNPNFIMLMDTREGRGIEAWVSLMEEHMAVFLSDQELRNYASFNPSAFN